MLQLGNEDKVIAYRTLLELETRSQEFEGLVERLKDQMLNQAQIIPPEVIASIDDLTWHLKQSARLIPTLEKTVGIDRSQRRAQKPARPATPNEQGLRGTTKSICVADLLGLLGQQSKTGTLWIKTQDELFVMEFCEGAVVHASTNKPLTEQRLGTILVAQNKVSEDRLEAELEQANSEGPIGETILRAELVSEADLRDALEHQVQELFHRLNQVEDAKFVFRDGEVSELEKRVCLSTTKLLLESARSTDEEQQAPQLDEMRDLSEAASTEASTEAETEAETTAGDSSTDPMAVYGILVPNENDDQTTTESESEETVDDGEAASTLDAETNDADAEDADAEDADAEDADAEHCTSTTAVGESDESTNSDLSNDDHTIADEEAADSSRSESAVEETEEEAMSLPDAEEAEGDSEPEEIGELQDLEATESPEESDEAEDSDEPAK